jgi:hypothetical protein
MFLDFDGTLVEPNVAVELVGPAVEEGSRGAREVVEELHQG